MLKFQVNETLMWLIKSTNLLRVEALDILLTVLNVLQEFRIVLEVKEDVAVIVGNMLGSIEAITTPAFLWVLCSS